MIDEFKPTAQIRLDFEGIKNPDELKKIQTTIEVLFREGVFHLKNGKAILNFDHIGALREISFDYKKWKS